MKNQTDKRKAQKKKKSQNNLEAQVFAFVQKSMKTALDAALNDIFKDWK